MKVWSEKNGRTDVTVYGFSAADNIMAVAAAVIILVACWFTIGGLS